MLAITRTYDDFNGNSRTEDFLFNLTEAEILNMELSENGGLSTIMKKLQSRQNIKEIIKIFKDLVGAAYGEKSADGRTFVKNEKIRAEFEATQAYADIYFELCTDAKKATAFINGIIPSKLRDKLAELEQENGVAVPASDN